MAFPTQAMILAAGRGTRLGELGERRAKALVEVGGEPLLAYQLRFLAALGVERAVINASHLAEQLEGFAEEHPGPPSLQVVIEPEALGTAGGVINALPLFSSAPILILYGDVICGEDLAPMGNLHAAGSSVATLAVFHSDDARQKGVVELSGDRIIAFHEKDPERPSGLVNAGIYIAEPEWLGGFERNRPLDFGHDVFPAALRSGIELAAHRLADPVLDIGTPRDLERAQEGELPDLSALGTPGAQ